MFAEELSTNFWQKKCKITISVQEILIVELKKDGKTGSCKLALLLQDSKRSSRVLFLLSLCLTLPLARFLRLASGFFCL